jgi:hypothetical protein
MVVAIQAWVVAMVAGPIDHPATRPRARAQVDTPVLEEHLQVITTIGQVLMAVEAVVVVEPLPTGEI